MGDLFVVRGVQPDVLDSMTITRMSYWHRWHEIANKHEEEQARRNAAK